MAKRGHCKAAKQRRTEDAVTWLVALYGSAAGTEALLHAFMREHDGDSLGAQFFIEVYRVIVERNAEGG